MNDRDELIRAAVRRRYASLAVPACPDISWRIAETMPVAKSGPPVARSRTLRYVAAAAVLLAIAGLSANASTLIALSHIRFMGGSSSRPLPPMIHAADRLTVKEAQRRVPFVIVLPKGLPEHTTFDYAEVASAEGSAHVNLSYQALVGNRYYRLVFGESTIEAPSRIPVEVGTRDGAVHKYYLPVRRWRHDTLFMSLITPGLADGVSERIARANAG